MGLIAWTILFVAGLGLFCFQVWKKLGLLLKMRRDDERDYSPKTWGTRAVNTLLYVFGQKKFLGGEQPAGWMHIVIFWGFIILFVQVVTMFCRGWFPDFELPGFAWDQLGRAYSLVKEFFQVGVLIAVAIALVRWLVLKPSRLIGILPAEEKHREQTHWEAILILVFIATIMLSGFFYDADRLVQSMSQQGVTETKWQPVTACLAQWLSSKPGLASTLGSISWWLHNIVILAFLNLLPRSKHFHIVTVIPNIFLGRVEPKGKLPRKNLEADDAIFGRSLPTHFTWKQVLDMYTCTECGRCSSQCPATATGKPLAPRQFLMNLRDHLADNQAKILSSGSASPDFDVIVGDGKPISDKVIWSCVNCRACEEACPVNVEYIDKVDDIRQHLVQEASRFPDELGRAFRGMETQSNPWGISAEEKISWAQGLEIPTVAEKPDAQYLFYVGCGGALDAGAKKATVAFAKILKAAKVSFAILGKDEPCCGETARRLGNEYLFQTMAQALVERINSTGIKKILINCPHGYNTLKNEYPDFGGHWEVIHAAAFVKTLLKNGTLRLKGTLAKKIVYHDSCNYGRMNDVYAEPRELIRQSNGKPALEMDKSGRSATCCGAGGGAMWLEEDKDKRVNVLRTEQALKKSPEVIATSCPFCRVMFDSAINEKELNDKVKTMDVMEIVAASVAPQSSDPG